MAYTSRDYVYFIAPSHPHAEVTKLLCPHHEGTGGVIKFKRIRWYCIIAIVNRESIMYCTPFEPCLRFLVPPHFTNKTRADIMVDNFKWLALPGSRILMC